MSEQIYDPTGDYLSRRVRRVNVDAYMLGKHQTSRRSAAPATLGDIPGIPNFLARPSVSNAAASIAAAAGAVAQASNFPGAGVAYQGTQTQSAQFWAQPIHAGAVLTWLHPNAAVGIFDSDESARGKLKNLVEGSTGYYFVAVEYGTDSRWFNPNWKAVRIVARAGHDKTSLAAVRDEFTRWAKQAGFTLDESLQVSMTVEQNIAQSIAPGTTANNPNAPYAGTVAQQAKPGTALPMGTGNPQDKTWTVELGDWFSGNGSAIKWIIGGLIAYMILK